MPQTHITPLPGTPAPVVSLMIREGCDPNSPNIAFGTSRPSDVLGNPKTAKI